MSLESGFVAGDIVRAMVREGRRILREAQAIAAKQGVRAQGVLVESSGSASAAGVILREAKKSRAELIVLGTHGRRGVRRVVLGSDAEQVVRSATRPVLLVRVPERA